MRDIDVGQHIAFITPVDLGWGARHDLETAVQPRELSVIVISQISSWPPSGDAVDPDGVFRAWPTVLI